MRLDKYLSDMGLGSRKDVKDIIRKGLVAADGVSVRDPGLQIDESRAEVFVDGEKIIYKKYIYLLLNKPPGLISATTDPRGRDTTVIDILPEQYKSRHLFPVGRLDKDTAGLLLLTNDGKFSHDLTSPRKNVIKTYYAAVTGKLTPDDAEAFKKGLRISGYICKPAGLEGLEAYPDDFKKLCRKNIRLSYTEGDVSEAVIKISEGKFHQVKLMFNAVGKTVLYLKRVGFGEYTLPADLEEGEVREV